MLKDIFLFVVIFSIGFTSISQRNNLNPYNTPSINQSNVPYPGEPCASSYLEDEKLKNPVYAQLRANIETQLQSYIAQQSSSRAAGVVYTIPVVFHIMHSGEVIGDSTNISLAQVQSAIAALNRDFRRTNADGGIAQGGPLGVDAEIEFCLAQRDPNGNATDGVTRTDMSGIQNYLDSGVYHTASLWRHDASMKAMVQWNPSEYLNVWVVNKIRNLKNLYSGGFTGGVIGYATFPGGASGSDGIVILSTAVGNDPTGVLGHNLWFATDDGRTLTHEVGHYLQLYHTFQGSIPCGPSGVNCATTGDRCCDTPPSLTGSSNNCTTPTCPLSNKENYMDYANRLCASDFTPDQVARMRAVLASTAWWGRNALVNTNNCSLPPSIDLELDTIFVPIDTICNSSFTPEIVICNNSSSDSVTTLDIKYRVDAGAESSFSWIGNLQAGDCDTFFLPSLSTTNGVHTFTARVDSVNINGSENDILTSNNSKTNTFTISFNTIAVMQLVSVCDSFVSPTGKVWTTNGTYSDTMTNVFGCDSLLSYGVTINSSTVTSISLSGCDSVISPSGEVYNSSGVYSDTVSALPCDSIYNVTVTINHASIGDSLYLDWANMTGGSGNNEEADAVTTDINGNVFTTGYFHGTVDFDPGPGIFNLTANGINYDIFITKFDPTGNFIWAKQLSGLGTDKAYAIVTDKLGNVYITGSFQDTLDFDPGVGINNIAAVSTNDAFILKLDVLGNFGWVKHYGASNGQIGYSITIDESDNIYATGGFYSTIDFDDGPGVSNLTPAGVFDIYFLKINSSGNFVWAKRIGGPNYEQAYSIHAKKGFVYLTGNFQTTVDFDPNAGTANLSVAGGNDAFVAKYDTSGNYIWAKSLSGTNIANGESVVTDNLGNVYSTGYFRNTFDFDPGAGNFNLTSAGNVDVYISKLDANGNFVWAKRIGANFGDYATSIHSDFNNDVYVTGSFNGTVDFDPNAGVNNITTYGQLDTYIGKYSSSGNLIWAHNIGGPLSDVTQGAYLDDKNQIYIAGYSTGTSDFDPTQDTFNIATTGLRDIFAAKYFQQFLTEDSACGSYISPSGIVWSSSGIYFDSLSNANGCDSILKFDLVISPQFIDSTSDTACQSYTWRTNTYTTSGLYRDTVFGGCDSIYILNLLIDTIVTNLIDTTLCSGDSIILLNGTTVKTTGTYYDTIPDTTGSSAFTTVLFSEDFEGATNGFTLNSIDAGSISPGTNDNAWIVNDIYEGGSFLVLGVLTVNIPNTPIQDSLITGDTNSNYLHIHSRYAENNSTPAILNSNYIDASLSSFGGQNGLNFSRMTADVSTVGFNNVSFNMYYLSKGSYGRVYFSTNSGTTWTQVGGNFNDSLWNNATITNAAFNNQTTLRFGVAFDNTNTPIFDPAFSVDEISIQSSDTIQGIGCDSVIRYDVIVIPVIDTNIYDTICSDVVYTLPGGGMPITSGVYRDTLISPSTMCDSIIITNLIVNDTTSSTQTITTCDSLVSPSGKIWKTTGIYNDTITNNSGCDSLMTFNLTITSVFRDTTVSVTCDSSVTWRGTTYNTTLVVNDTVTSGVCDSIFTLDFTRNSVFLSTINYIVCDSVTVFTGRFIDSSGTYDDSLVSPNGCDSIYRFIVIVNSKDTSTQNITTCDSLVSPSGKIWKSTGTYLDTINTSKGCDSIITFNLTISTSTIVNNPTISGCDSVQINGVWYDSSQNIYDTISSGTGCDTINVTPIQVDTGTWSITTLAFCDSLVAGSGKVYKNSGFYRDTMPNSKGCDSLVEYYLTANKSKVTNLMINACGSYTSSLGNTYTTSGLYADTFATSTGCDSIINMNVIIDTVVTVSLDSTICFGDSITLSNGTIIKSSGVYYDTVYGSIPSSLLYSENFQGATHSFTLNTNDTNAITPGASDNAWIVNNSYTGGSVFGQTVVNTPNQDATITGNINSTYLHIMNRRTRTLSFGTISNTNYLDGNIVLLGGQNGLNFSKMTNDISTLGKSVVSFDMYYLCRGSFGRLYYSINSGATWNRVGGNINNGGQKWSQFSIVDSAFANQPTLRFAVGFNNTDGLGVTPGFAVDQIAINGIGASSTNCDSITTINLTVSPLVDTNLFDTICRGQSITLPNGGLASITGIYIDTLTSNSGCDSIVNTNLFVYDTTQSSFTLRECDSVTSPSGKVWTVSGTYIDSIQNSVGCDSVMNITVIIDTVPVLVIDTVLCFNDSMTLMNGTVVNTSGIYYDTIATIRCDSLVQFNVTILPLNDTLIFDTICANDSYVLPSGTIVNTAGIYSDTLNSRLNCDSIIITNLSVGDTSSSVQVIATCDSLISPSGKVWTTTGMYFDTIPNNSGCDSLMTFNVTISMTTFFNVSDTACDSFVWRTQTLTSSGFHYDTITTGVCDTIYVLNLLINNSSIQNIPVTACDSFLLPSGVTIYVSGLYRDTLISSSGCDSIINSSVTISTASSSTITTSECGSYTSPSGKVFTATGMYNDTITNSGGCDSLITINLTILTSTSFTLLANGCDTFRLPGGTLVTSTGSYTDTLISGNGCDSIITTNLILGYSSNVTNTYSICAGETVTVGSNTYGATGIYRDTFTTALGCDSIINSDITINPLTPGTITYTTNMCQYSTAVSFTATPAGGIWGGPGIDTLTGLFDPAVSGAGIHTITYKGPGPCGTTDTAIVEVYSAPTIISTITDDECDEGQGAIDVTIVGGTPALLYTWSNGETTEDLTGLKEGSLTLTVLDANGCSGTATMSVINVSSPDCDYNIFVPNIFSPDGNGENDVLFVEGNGVETLDLKIFNRWGNLIFETNSPTNGWDGTYKGKPVNQGAFVYFVKGTFVDGSEFNEKGTITVIRR